MELTELEREILGWFISEHWQEFAEKAEEYLGVNGLHRLAEKLRLGEQPS